VYQPEIHVPLLIVAPPRIPARTVVPGVVSLRDLPATIVDLLGFEADSPFPGRSFVPGPRSGAVETGRTVPGIAFAEFSTAQDRPAGLRYQNGSPGLTRVIIEDGMTYHRHGDGREEFYGLRNDPLEGLDLATANDSQRLIAPYRKRLNRFVPRN
jgi:arylsulfatase A-like enzyme